MSQGGLESRSRFSPEVFAQELDAVPLDSWTEIHYFDRAPLDEKEDIQAIVAVDCFVAKREIEGVDYIIRVERTRPTVTPSSLTERYSHSVFRFRVLQAEDENETPFDVETHVAERVYNELSEIVGGKESIRVDATKLSIEGSLTKAFPEPVEELPQSE